VLNIKIQVRYEGDWTDELRDNDVFGQFLASTFRNRRYLGIIKLDVAAEDYESTLKTIRGHENTQSMDVIKSNETNHGRRKSVDLLIKGSYLEYTPLQILIYEGYLPNGAFGELQNGKMGFDLLVEDRESISDTVSLLREFGTVTVERITQDFDTVIVPSITEWQSLFESIPTRQRELLNTAMEQGYYEMPREITLKELADEVGIAKTTASQHLRKAERRLVSFTIKYVNFA
jgi:predicted DNA binding protein